MVQRCSRAARDLGEFIVWDASDMMCVPGATEDERKEALKLLGQELGIDTSKIIRYVDNDEYRLRK